MLAPKEAIAERYPLIAPASEHLPPGPSILLPVELDHPLITMLGLHCATDRETTHEDHELAALLAEDVGARIHRLEERLGSAAAVLPWDAVS